MLYLALGVAPARAEEGGSAPSPAAIALGRAAAPFLALHTFQAEFVQTQEWVGMDDPSFFKGMLYLERPNRFRLQYEEPKGHLQVCDGETVYTYVPENEQVLAARLPRDGRADLLGRILEESVPDPETQEAELDGVPVRILTLDPPDGLELESVRLWTRSDSGAILQYELNELSGNRSTFRFMKTWSDPKLDPDLFRFEAPKGVPVVEVG
ncbi:MAG: outer membrane lipoprotein carrier protein LolA [Candidatus Eisenbacteria bacterium]